jgi:hypothetical protein
MRARSSLFAFVLTVLVGVVTALPAAADHTTPPGPLSSNTETSQAGLAFGIGGIPAVPNPFTHITNFPANPGSDMIMFRKRVGSTRELYASNGTLGGGDEQHVGQRIIRLTSNGGNTVDPTWIADHGSANCPGTGSTGNTGLQHDATAAGMFRRTSIPTSIPGADTLDIQLILDASDASGRCHDTGGGGLEIIDITTITQPRELHLTRHIGTTHTTTTDALRPWIVYSSNSSFAGHPWIDVLDVRTCLNLGTMSLADKRTACRPKVYRMLFALDPTQQPPPPGAPVAKSAWTYQRNFYDGGGAIDNTQGSSGCHDITAIGSRLYCAGVRASMILDVSNLTDENGNVRGTQMPCPVIAGTSTTAMVTNCSQMGLTLPAPAPPNTPTPTVDPTAFEFLGTRNHAGIDCTSPPLPRNSSCNSNLLVPVGEDIAISHEFDPTHDARVGFATDERGGGVVPPGASCTTAGPTEFSNGGIHALDIRGATPGRDPADNFPYMLDPAGNRAVFQGAVRLPSGSFCTVHMIEHAHDEQRLFVAYYSQGTKVVDYFFHDQGTATLDDDRISFRETASFILPGANTWMAHPFKTVNNPDGTRTYYLIANDIQRGIDIFSYTAMPNPIGAPPPAEAAATATIQAGNAGAGLLVLAAILPAAALLRRRRRSRA